MGHSLGLEKDVYHMLTLLVRIFGPGNETPDFYGMERLNDHTHIPQPLSSFTDETQFSGHLYILYLTANGSLPFMDVGDNPFYKSARDRSKPVFLMKL